MKSRKHLTGMLVAMMGAGMLSLSSSSAAAPIYDNVQYFYTHGYIELSNLSVTNLNAGYYDSHETRTGGGLGFTLSGDWRVVETDGGAYCPNCVIQAYVGWIDPAGAYGANPLNLGLLSFNDANHGNTNGEVGSGHFSWNTTTPLEDGTYYVGANFSLEYDFNPGVPGQFGIGPAGAASYQVDVDHDVPEPASLALAGLGLAGMIGARRRANRG